MGPGVHVPSWSIGRGHLAGEEEDGAHQVAAMSTGNGDCSFPTPMKWPLNHRERSKSHPSHSQTQDPKLGRASPSVPAGPRDDARPAGMVLCYPLLSQGAFGGAGKISTYKTRPNPAAAF